MGDFGVVDYTPLMAIAPRTENFLEKLGVFSAETAEYKDNRYAEFERELKGTTGMYNVARGGDRQFMGSESAEKQILEAPFATLDGVTRANEVEAFREYGTESATASVEALVERKVAHIQRSHAKYIRDVQYTALIDNKVHAVDKNGNEITSLAKNFSTLWGGSRKTGTVDPSNAGVDPFTTLALKRQEIIDDMGSNTGFTSMVVMVSTRDFNAIVNHPLVRSAYENRDGGSEYLTRRLGNDALYQIFEHKGIVLLEDTSSKIVDGSAVMFPLGVEDMFMHSYHPADTLEHVNQISQGSYLFMVSGWRQEVIESELSYICNITRPELVADLTITVQ